MEQPKTSIANGKSISDYTRLGYIPPETGDLIRRAMRKAAADAGETLFEGEHNVMGDKELRILALEAICQHYLREVE